jgi:site-specific DNA recombinase
MRELEAERTSLADRLDAAKEANDVIALHPKALDRYKGSVMRLAKTLSEGSPVEQQTIRELVTAVIVYASPSRPGGAGSRANAEDDRSVQIDIKGRLAALCDNPALFPNMGTSGGALVARERYLLTHTSRALRIQSFA